MNKCGLLFHPSTCVRFLKSFSSLNTKKPYKFCDKYELSQEEIDKILKRKSQQTPEPPHKPDPLPAQNIDLESKTDEKLQKIFSQKINYEIPDRFIADFEQKKHKIPISDQSIIKPDEKSDKPPVTYKEKYGLPIPNKEMPSEELFEFEYEKKVPETTNMKVMNLLNITEETPYETYELELQKKFNFEMDMYGSATDENEIREQQINTLREELIPLTLLKNENYMSNVRKCFTLNISMPGTLENEHPHRFLKNLRPVEEFRNTPLIPISDKLMQAHRDRVEKYHRAGVYFEVKKDTLFNLGVFGIAVCMMYMLLKFVSGKEEEAAVAYQRLRIQRTREY